MADIELYDEWLRVPLSGGHADFHFKWLRHQCDLDRHPATGERVVDSSEIPDGVRPRAVRLREDALIVEWADDGRTSRYPGGSPQMDPNAFVKMAC